MSNNNNQVYDPSLYCRGYEEATDKNKPKFLRERIPPHELLLIDAPTVVFGLFILSGGLNHPHSLFTVTMLVLLWLWAMPGLVVIPLHIIMAAMHKRTTRYEIIEWSRRGWVRPGFEPTQEMVREAERRNAKMRSRRSSGSAIADDAC